MGQEQSIFFFFGLVIRIFFFFFFASCNELVLFSIFLFLFLITGT
jgi:hypothetical protein